MAHAWGGSALFEEPLGASRQIAARHAVSIANVAVRAILDRRAVGGVIVGTRLGLSEHIADTARVFGLRLTPEDHAEIEAVLARSRDLYQRIGDCGAEYRR
jgi:aryl-alcohol dehydrogenase-like predicted oxidoreductase